MLSKVIKSDGSPSYSGEAECPRCGNIENCSAWYYASEQLDHLRCQVCKALLTLPEWEDWNWGGKERYYEELKDFFRGIRK